jgi:hypothetical protein
MLEKAESYIFYFLGKETRKSAAIPSKSNEDSTQAKLFNILENKTTSQTDGIIIVIIKFISAKMSR